MFEVTNPHLECYMSESNYSRASIRHLISVRFWINPSMVKQMTRKELMKEVVLQTSLCIAMKAVDKEDKIAVQALEYAIDLI